MSRIPLTEVRDIFIFRIYLCQYIHALSYQYFQFMYITCIYLSYHCLGWYTVRIWVFVCVCCAAPDKLTSPPPFTWLGALHLAARIIWRSGGQDMSYRRFRSKSGTHRVRFEQKTSGEEK